jgi:phage pi2 protein 07
MKTQNITGQSTEQKVQNRLKSVGLETKKPKRDIGVDLEVWRPGNSKRVKIQIKGRGKTQQNRRYRWFQIRTTKKQREDTLNAGLLVSEAWKKKVDLCDFFVLVSEKHEEQWVFPAAIVHEIVNINKIKYSNREDNMSGKQAEMDLDIEYGGKSLTEIYESYKNNFALISEKLNSA